MNNYVLTHKKKKNSDPQYNVQEQYDYLNIIHAEILSNTYNNEAKKVQDATTSYL